MAEKILIVDDDLDTLRLVGLMLQRQGYQISAATNGQQGLDKAFDEDPDLILLDVMMPDMDGYEVTRRMRANTKTTHIPIIMFTAKTLVGDKVAGFQAGADDYLTKPIHPAELSSRVEAVLLRSSRARVETTARPHARILGVMGVKGGVGTTTLAINLSVALAQSATQDNPRRVALADLHASAGDIALQLGLTRSSGLPTLLSRKPDEINSKAVESLLVGHVSGARLLLAPSEQRLDVKDIPGKHADVIIRHLGNLSDVVVLDLGSRIDEGVDNALPLCARLIIALEPQRPAVLLAQALLARAEKAGLGPDRVMPVVVNRSPSASTMNKSTIENLLGHEVASVIPPAPEVAFMAAEQGSPIIMVQPGNIVSDQFRELARQAMSGPAS